MSDKSPQLPVPAGPVIDHGRSDRVGGKPGGRGKKVNVPPDDITYAAQLLSGGEKRGLKGGSETLGRAKTTYLKAEYSGPNDRRPRPGRVTRTDI
ncbi:hypothetical protein [Asticcacaulis sp. EMRT-3]|uniref:hypothetical protein n=1 Tax=Asticcacaulis sp. EMRT-3 TaxID=3040349 RepID=UPI0024AEC051|nr:hypothetical protein [Asticcacaulis sp. EMRT-3]MDI7773786.1 hypothetical protein [Asticcacaulis sp. EMRT-3]